MGLAYYLRGDGLDVIASVTIKTYSTLHIYLFDLATWVPYELAFRPHYLAEACGTTNQRGRT